MPANPNDADKYIDVNQFMYPSTGDFVNHGPASPNAPVYNQESQNANYSQPYAPPSYDHMYNNNAVNMPQPPPPAHHNPPPPIFMQSPPPPPQMYADAPQWQQIPPQGMQFNSMPQNAAYVQYTAPPPPVAIMMQPQVQRSPEEEAKRKYTRDKLKLADKIMRTRMSVGTALVSLCLCTASIVCVWFVWLIFALLFQVEPWWHIAFTHVLNGFRVFTFLSVILIGVAALVVRNAKVRYAFSHMYCASLGAMMCCCYCTLAAGVIAISFISGVGGAVTFIIGGCFVGCVCVPVCICFGASGVHNISVSKQVYEFEKFHKEDQETNPVS